MAMRIIGGGSRFNRMLQRGQQLGTAASGIAAVGSMDTQFGIANIYDSFPSKAARWAANSGGEAVTWDAGLIYNGDFETAFVSALPGIIGGWGKDAGAALTRNTLNQRTGAGCMQVAGSTTDRAYVDVYCSPGDRYQIDAAARKLTAGSGTAAKVEIQNLATGKWLTSGGAWQASETSILSNATTAYTTVSQQFTVEAFEQCQTLDVVLRIGFMAGSGTPGTHDALYDDCQLVPGIDVVSLHGAGVTYTFAGLVRTGPIAPQTTIEIRTGTDGITYGTTVATMAALSPGFYKLFTLTYARYWKFNLATAQTQQPGYVTNLFVYIGELVFGQTVTLLRDQSGPFGVTFSDPRQDSGSAYGEMRSTISTSGPRRVLDMSFVYISTASYQEARDAIWRMTRNGATPLVVIPDDADPDLVIFGYPDGSDFKTSKSLVTSSSLLAQADWTMREAPQPQWIA